MQQSRIDYLRSLRNEIASMTIVKCRMVHERIVGVADSKQPISGNLKRVGLCSPEVRAERLGCGHTMSRVRLDRVINELETAVAEPLAYELNFLTNEIHLLDHRKGEAETQRARAELEAKRVGEELELVKETTEIVKGLEQQHDIYVEKMKELMDRVVLEIDKAIADIQQ